jgi:hypothetical protein
VGGLRVANPYNIVNDLLTNVSPLRTLAGQIA